MNKDNAKHWNDISKEKMAVVWHPTRWWDCCISEDKKIEIDQNFTDKVKKW